ncbi:MAG: hypothetical protein H5T59_12425 [Anaerolineae bacterium]|nr:hypothetical protein [Anaerolineae bacterium]
MPPDEPISEPEASQEPLRHKALEVHRRLLQAYGTGPFAACGSGSPPGRRCATPQ